MTDATRPGEVLLRQGLPEDATLSFLGRIHTPWSTRADCPHQGRLDGPLCTVEVIPEVVPALKGLSPGDLIELTYWLHHSRRDLLVQRPRRDGDTLFGTFALRSPQRMNPLGISVVVLEGIDGHQLRVRGLDCADGTPLIDIKPERCGYSPKAAPKAADRP